MVRSVVIAAGLGLLAAVFYLSVKTFSPGALILVYLTQFPLFVAGLSMGVKGAAIAAATGGTLLFVEGGLFSGTAFLLMDALPVLLLVHHALRWRADPSGRVWWYPAGRLVLWLVGLGCTGLLAAAAWAAGDPGGLGGASYEAAAIVGSVLGGRGIAVSERMIATIAGIFPAAATLSWLAMIAVNAVLAQGVLARFGRNRRPAPDMTEIELPHWTPWVLAALVAMAVLGGETLGYLGRQLLIVSALAFFFAGLAVVHAAARRFAAHGLVLAATYVAVLVFGWPIAAIATLGFIEQWAGLRRRLAGRGEV